MLSPNFVSHVFNGHILCLRNQEDSEEAHNKNPSREKQEDSELKVTQHGQETLCNNKGEQHVCEHCHTLSS